MIESIFSDVARIEATQKEYGFSFKAYADTGRLIGSVEFMSKKDESLELVFVQE